MLTTLILFKVWYLEMLKYFSLVIEPINSSDHCLDHSKAEAVTSELQIRMRRIERQISDLAGEYTKHG